MPSSLESGLPFDFSADNRLKAAYHFREGMIIDYRTNGVKLRYRVFRKGIALSLLG